MGVIHYTPGQQQPIVDREDYIRQQQQCSLLTDVCSQMARRWRQAGEPLNKTYSILTDPKSQDPYGGTFSWTAENLCEADEWTTNPVKFKNYSFPEGGAETLIWTAFKYGPGFKNIHIEPAAFIAYEKGKPETAYLAFRGSQTAADFGIDAQYEQVPNPMDVLGGTIMKGFEKYFAGCGIKQDGSRPAHHFEVPKPPGKTLWQSLYDISYKNGGSVKRLIVTGHSLGSTTAQLSGALACHNGWFERVIVSCSASPRVGTAGFKEWYDKLHDQGNPHRMLNDRTYRLTNKQDSVPKNPKAPYVDLGNEPWFDEGNGNEHNPCCTYSHAINNPDDVHNRNIASCEFPSPPAPPLI